MATDASGKEGFSTGTLAKELVVSPAKVKRALAELKIDPDFVKAGCSYYYPERIPQLKTALK